MFLPICTLSKPLQISCVPVLFMQHMLVSVRQECFDCFAVWLSHGICVQRLEAEAEQDRGRLEEEYRSKAESLVARHDAAFKEAKKGEARFAEKFRTAAEAGRAADDRAAAAEQHLVEMRKELGAKNDRLRWFEEQVRCAL